MRRWAIPSDSRMRRGIERTRVNSGFRYRSDQVLEIIRAPKRVRDLQTVAGDRPFPFRSYGQAGRRLDLDLDLVDGPLVNLVLHVRAGLVGNPTTYEAALILDGTRVRGVGYELVERTVGSRSESRKGGIRTSLIPTSRATMAIGTNCCRTSRRRILTGSFAYLLDCGRFPSREEGSCCEYTCGTTP
jgi:hypothetical protein